MSPTNYEEIIKKCYLELLNRVPDTDALTHFSNLLKSNSIDENGIKSQLKNSDEYSSLLLSKKYTVIITRCFLEILDREPDAAALNKYLLLLKSNSIDENGIKSQLKNSDEYSFLLSKKYTVIITRCFLEILDREPDAAALNKYLLLLKSNSIDENGIKSQLKNSDEYSFLLSKKYTVIITRCFLEILDREPDAAALNKYLLLLKSNSIDENGIKSQLKNSDEYNLHFPTEIKSDTSIDIRMKKEWNARAKNDVFFSIATDASINESDFWNSGLIDCKKILDNKTQKFLTLINKSKPIKYENFRNWLRYW